MSRVAEEQNQETPTKEEPPELHTSGRESSEISVMRFLQKDQETDTRQETCSHASKTRRGG